MDDIAARLKDTSEICMKAYDVWLADKKDMSTKSPLQEAVHDLRKVAARIEIELAVSERDEHGRAIPIPAHQSRGRHNNNNKKPAHNKKAPPKPADNKDRKDSQDGQGDDLPAFISGNENAPADTPPKRAPRRRPTPSNKD